MWIQQKKKSTCLVKQQKPKTKVTTIRRSSQTQPRYKFFPNGESNSAHKNQSPFTCDLSIPRPKQAKSNSNDYLFTKRVLLSIFPKENKPKSKVLSGTMKNNTGSLSNSSQNYQNFQQNGLSFLICF